MQIESGAREVLPVCSILLGFLIAGFWWTFNRELSFKTEDRHFKLGITLLFLAMVMLGVFGVVLPIRQIAYSNRAFLLGYRGGVGIDHGVWIHADRHGPVRPFQAPEVQN